jgi:hypothetical protein
MVGLVAALALTTGLFHFGGPTGGHDVRVRFYHGGGWRFTIRQDRFRGQTTCAIYKHDIRYAEGVITFRFGQRVDTANARFRLDNGPPREAGSVAVEAAGLGAQFNGPSLSNPSNGEVHIPADVVAQATTVAIQPNNRTNHRTFNLTGLPRALEIAKAQHCDDLAGRVSALTPNSWRHLLPASIGPNGPGRG